MRTMRFAGIVCAILVVASAGWALNHPNSVPIEAVQSVELSYPIRFVVLGDTRWPGVKIFADHREQILMLDPQPLFVIDVGDLVYLGAEPEYQQYLSMIDPYPLPFISVIGNHEMYFPGGRDRYAKYFGPEDFYFDYGPLRFVAANNAVPYSPYILEQAQLDWMTPILTDPSVPMIFVFMHVPPPEFENWEAYHQLLLASGRVPISFHGHEHYYEMWVDDGVTYIITGGGGAEITGNREEPPYHGDFHHFCVVDVYPDGGVDVQVIRHGEGTTPDDRYGVFVQWQDFIPPIVESTLPADGEQDVSVATGIAVTFVEPMDAASTEFAFSIRPEVAGHFEWQDERTMIFIPDEPLAGETRYTVTIGEGAADASGNGLDGDKDGRAGGEFVFSFETGAGEGDEDGAEEDSGCGCEY